MEIANEPGRSELPSDGACPQGCAAITPRTHQPPAACGHTMEVANDPGRSELPADGACRAAGHLRLFRDRARGTVVQNVRALRTPASHALRVVDAGRQGPDR